MSKPRVFITRQIPKKGLDLLRETCDITLWHPETPPTYEDVRKIARDCDGLLTMLTEHIDGDMMDAAPDLIVISNFAVGYDNIDIAAATTRGIPVGHTPGVLTESSADLAFALLMSAARRLPEAEAYVKAGLWQSWHPLTLLGHDIHGATLGIVGFGRIGQAVARRGTGFSMRILYHGGSDRTAAEEIGAQEVDFDTLLAESDFVSVHVPLKPETQQMINADAFKKMKKTAILINTARGPIVDTDALYEALKTHKIAAAALDVTDPEPLPADHRLLTLENCLVIPHIASASYATREQVGVIAAKNLLAGLNGDRLPHVVNPEVYDR